MPVPWELPKRRKSRIGRQAPRRRLRPGMWYEMPKALALIAHNLEGIYSVVFDMWCPVAVAFIANSCAIGVFCWCVYWVVR